MPSPQIRSLADRSGKSPQEVEKMWDAIKASLKDQGHKESDPNFYPLLVGSLKNSLGIEEKITRAKELLNYIQTEQAGM